MRRSLAVALAVATTAGLGGLWLVHRARPVPSTEMTPERLDRAIAYFEQALTRDTLNPMLKGQLIHRLILRFGQQANLADLVHAEDLATTSISLASDTSSALARLSGVMLMQHKFGPSLATAQAAVARDSGSADARGALLEAAIAAGRYRVADAQAATMDQSSVAGLVRRATWLDASGRSETAVGLMEHACRELERSASPAQVTAWCLTQLATMIHSTRGPDEAERLLNRVLVVQPGYRGGLEGLANLALARGEANEAVDRFRAILSNAHPDLYLRLADGYRLLGQPDSVRAAEARFLEIAGAKGYEALFGNVLALYYAERGDRPALDSALAIAEREIERRPTNESFDLLGWVHYRRGEYRSGLAAADRALQWGVLSPTMRYHRGRLLQALGRTAEGSALVAEATAQPTLLLPHARRDWRRVEKSTQGPQA